MIQKDLENPGESGSSEESKQAFCFSGHSVPRWVESNHSDHVLPLNLTNSVAQSLSSRCSTSHQSQSSFESMLGVP